VQATFAATIELTDLPGIAVSANSFTSPGGEPTNAIDNKDYLDGQFSWVAGDHGTPDDPNWLQLDFGSDFYLMGVEVRGIFNEELPWFWGNNNVFNLWAQQDGGAWVAIGDGDIQDSADPALRDKTFGYLPGAQPLARYLRYEVVGGSHWSYLGEINVQGATVPEPCTIASAAAGLLCIVIRRWRSLKCGALQWTQQLGTSATDWSFGVSADGLGNIYFFGYTSGSLDGPNAGVEQRRARSRPRRCRWTATSPKATTRSVASSTGCRMDLSRYPPSMTRSPSI
jgi:hypothetical protein